MSLDAVAREILNAAAEIGGETWVKIRKSAPIFVRAYAQSLLDIAAGVALGPKDGISKSDAKIFIQNARLLLIMGIANTNQILLVQAQKFIDRAIAAARAAVNKALPISLL
ncbi:MAG: hypothetical protein JNL61_15705 [Rhizobiaceae bacterium]|nr:hypothetical protein [Rhizobiaceae bacterium]